MISHAIIAGVISLGIAPAPFFASSPSDLTCHLVQMHVRVHSNYNGGDLPASMERHCYGARSHGLGAVWWTDRDEIFGDGFETRVEYACFARA